MQTNARKYTFLPKGNVIPEGKPYSHAKAMRMLDHEDIRIQNRERMSLSQLELNESFVDCDGDTWERVE